MIKLRYIGKDSDPVMLIEGNVYDAVGENTNSFAVIDETGEDYLYLKKFFEPADEQATNYLALPFPARLNQTS
ncbi:MAG: hypothetical protein RSA89_02830 [Raoultibacter sp.]